MASSDARCPSPDEPAWVAAACSAAAVPCLLAFNLPPSSTLLNQAAALIGWGGLALLCAVRSAAPTGRRDAGLGAAVVALGLLLAAALAAPAWTGQPWSIALPNAGMVACAGVLLLAGAATQAAGRGVALFRAVCWAWLVTGVASLVVGLVQVFVPDLADGDWIARTSFPGRAVGNLRQPNHLSSLLLWSAIAVIGLMQTQPAVRRGVASIGWVVAFVAMVFGIVLTASRTGVVGIGLLALWGLVDRRLARGSRTLLLLAPLMYALAWAGLAAWAHASAHVFGGESRFSAEGDLSSSRFAIWSNSLTLIARHPWWGVGFGEFNFAWTLTPFPGRPVAFFDHTHNLPLHFAVELGLPLAALVLVLLLAALWRAFRAAVRADGVEGGSLRAAFMMVATMALHSQLEYPLWYGYFLLPTALVLGLGLGGMPSPRPPGPAPAVARPAGAPAGRFGAGAVAAGACCVMAAGLLMLLDYRSAVAIYTASAEAPPLAARIAAGQRSLLFAHQGDYAAATTAQDMAAAMAPAGRAAHYLLDARLMIAWAQALAASGDLERARHVAARLREFHHELGESFFEACEPPPSATTAATPSAAAPAAPRPFQCDAPGRAMDYRDFR